MERISVIKRPGQKIDSTVDNVPIPEQLLDVKVTDILSAHTNTKGV